MSTITMDETSTTTDEGEDAATLGALLRRFRGKRSLHSVAVDAGTYQQNLSNWEKGKRPQDRDIVKRLDVVLGANGAILRAYDLANADLAERVAQLEARMADMEATRVAAMPEIGENATQIKELWAAVRELARDVRPLVDPTPLSLEPPPGLAP